jgi:hypothetical protein
MNLSHSTPTDDDNLPTADQSLFDLLADGELDASRRVALLARLDDVPDGWRRCALAFLEAQSFRTDFREILDPPPNEVRTSPPAQGLLPGKGSWRTLLAVAATFLIALGLGVGMRDAFGPPARRGASAVRIAKAGGVSPASETASDEAVAGGVDDGATRLDAAPAMKTVVDKTPADRADAWQLVSLSLGDDSASGGESIRLPAIERESIDEAWLESLPQAMPPDVLRALENSGHRVRQDRRLMPLTMNDGRRLVVPVDQIELHYVGNRVAQ